MQAVTTIGLHIAKSVFQVHGVDEEGNMRFVETKTPERQSCLMLHRTRQLFIRQQTSVINAIRAHMAEFGIVAWDGRVLNNCLMSSRMLVTDGWGAHDSTTIVISNVRDSRVAKIKQQWRRPCNAQVGNSRTA
jgi:hypothetical protein